MSTGNVAPIHAFETIKTAFNRWRADNASTLSRDEAIRYALGEWLIQKGYLPPSPDGSLPSMATPPDAKASTPATYARTSTTLGATLASIVPLDR